MKDIEKCIEVNIEALIKAGFIKSKEELSKENLEELKKVIEHAEYPCIKYHKSKD